jgi:hypothetical protein
MKRILVTLMFCCAALFLFCTTPALSKPPVSGQISGLTEALSKLSPEELSKVLEGIGVSTIPAQVPKTGQTISYAAGDDGSLQKGVPWPEPRFTDNGNGTVTDNLTGLIWMKNAGALGGASWGQALIIANELQSGDADLTDDSVAGDWRLPNLRELQSLLSFGTYDPALPPGHPFTGVQSFWYWSSTTCAYYTTNNAWVVHFHAGSVLGGDESGPYYVWCVRGGP